MADRDTQLGWACHMLHHMFPDYDQHGHAAVPICDISQCLWVLANKPLFQELFLQWDAAYFAPCLGAFGDVADVSELDGANKMSSILLHFMVRECGFAPVPEIVFLGGTGDAFGAIVRAGMVFKDGLSAVHGEYSHTLQWAMIGWAARKGHINLQTSVLDVYKSLVDPRMVTKHAVVEEFKRRKTVTLWEVVCDTFDSRGNGQENCLKNIFSQSYRSPAYLMMHLLQEDLSGSVFGQLLWYRHLRKRFTTFDGQGGLTDIQHRARRDAEDRQKTPDSAGAVAYRPMHMSISRRTRRMHPIMAIPASPGEDNLDRPNNRVNLSRWRDWQLYLEQAR